MVACTFWPAAIGRGHGRIQAPGLQICDTDVERQRRLAVPMQPGDVLLFDGKLPHGTPVNTTREQRWAIQYHYRPAAAHEADDAERLSAFGVEGKGVTC